MTGDKTYLKLLNELPHRIPEIIEELVDLHLKKSAGYGQPDDPWANFRKSKEIGISAEKGAALRFFDKIERLKNVLKNPDIELEDENIKDTCMDLAAYALIIYCLIHEKALDAETLIEAEAISKELHGKEVWIKWLFG